MELSSYVKTFCSGFFGHHCKKILHFKLYFTTLALWLENCKSVTYHTMMEEAEDWISISRSTVLLVLPQSNLIWEYIAKKVLPLFPLCWIAKCEKRCFVKILSAYRVAHYQNTYPRIRKKRQRDLEYTNTFAHTHVHILPWKSSLPLSLGGWLWLRGNVFQSSIMFLLQLQHSNQSKQYWHF